MSEPIKEAGSGTLSFQAALGLLRKRGRENPVSHLVEEDATLSQTWRK